MKRVINKDLLYRALFFIGWLLSPFTFWNDAIVNIPISYLCANLAARYTRLSFLSLVLVFYWLSNGLGIVIMYFTGKKILEEQKGIVRAIADLFVISLIYSVILFGLYKIGILRPIL